MNEQEMQKRAKSLAERIESLAADGFLPPLPKYPTAFSMVMLITRAEALRDGRDPDEGAIFGVTANPN